MLEENLPLILISGIMCTEKLWSKQLAVLTKQIKIAIPKVTQETSIEDLAAEIIANYKPKFNVIGFSSGGYIAQELVRQAPKVVNKLIFMNTSGGNYSQKQQNTRLNFINVCEEKGAKEGLSAFIKKLNSTYINSDLETLEYSKRMVEEVSPEIFCTQFKSVYKYNQTAPSLSQITCPTLIIASDNDPFMTHEAYDEMVTSIPNAELRVIHGGGHMLPISKPEEISSIIIEFFNYPEHIQQERSVKYA